MVNNTYNSDHCWQYEVRKRNFQRDLVSHNLTIDIVKNLRVSDFTFKNIIEKSEQQHLKEFIEENEWLGNLSQYTTHWFGCYYSDILAGAILFNMPNAFSKLLGEDTKNLERLISRGACISWSPKNLASSFLMWCIKWMVKNTDFRLFFGYSNPIAKELGTIYQACGFYYLGQSAGATSMYINPYNGKIVSDRYFRQKVAFKKYAEELGIAWQDNWQDKWAVDWKNVPEDIEKKLREYSRFKQQNSERIDIPRKHKYVYILGKDKRETKYLRKLFESKNKIYPYPKERGK